MDYQLSTDELLSLPKQTLEAAVAETINGQA